MKQHKGDTYRLERDEVLCFLRDLVAGTGGTWDWDDFLYVPFRHARWKAVQRLCRDLSSILPSARENQYCSDLGAEWLTQLISVLETEEADERDE